MQIGWSLGVRLGIIRNWLFNSEENYVLRRIYTENLLKMYIKSNRKNTKTYKNKIIREITYLSVFSVIFASRAVVFAFPWQQLSFSLFPSRSVSSNKMEEEEQEPVHLEEASEGPGREYEIFLKNEELLDKLKLLNYEEGFLSHGFRPIQRFISPFLLHNSPKFSHYFVRSTNAGEQFYLFTSLAAWLIQKGGNSNFQMPQEVKKFITRER